LRPEPAAKFWLVISFIFAVAIIAGLSLIFIRFPRNQRIEISLPPSAGTATVAAVASQATQKININTADPWLLEALPGIGDTLAQRIVDYRTLNGPFTDTGQLIQVKGISISIFENIKGIITVDGN
jgi:competence ComEA-like helix-hairpin-helix protein